MTIKNIPYQSFFWVIGTTSFRTAKLNLKIEEQLLLLNEFYNIIIKSDEWVWNKELQIKYYEFMKNKKFLSGKAKMKDKDAREKTSGLVEIGLINKDRLITEAGKELLEIANTGDFEIDNIFNIDNDSYVYFKQLLKTSVKVNKKVTRPFIIVMKCLTELKYLTYDEFAYLIPLITDKKSYNIILSNIIDYREEKLTIEDIIFNRLISMENYSLANNEFINNRVDKALIKLIGMNRKSRGYDESYYFLYKNLKKVFLEGSTDYESLFNSVKRIKHRPGLLWKGLIFKSNFSKVRVNEVESISNRCPFLKCKNEEELKKIFFKYLHVYKAMSTLLDYFDLNRRYFNLTEILIFEDRTIKFDLIPKYYFAEIINELYEEAFQDNENLTKSISLEEISRVFSVDNSIIYSSLSNDLGISIKTSEQARLYVKNERYRRFNKLIDKKFDNDVLIELLTCFEKRDDKKIEKLVTDEATIPTIFEYILGIIWYKVSERQGNILDYIKLSLESNLLPKTHAAGGSADIVYEYDDCLYYPKHSLLIEATLSDGTNQRRMEMEPVSRHLGDYRVKFNNKFDYSLFISTYLDENLLYDFRYRKIMPYSKDEETITGMKIIPIDTISLKNIIKNNIKYKELYAIFEKYYNLDLNSEVTNWHNEMIKEITEEYGVLSDYINLKEN